MSIHKEFRLCSGLLAFLLVGGVANAGVSVPSIFSDHMVFQAGVEVPVWGKA